jgi:hypothetical protein
MICSRESIRTSHRCRLKKFILFVQYWLLNDKCTLSNVDVVVFRIVFVSHVNETQTSLIFQMYVECSIWPNVKCTSRARKCTINTSHYYRTSRNLTMKYSQSIKKGTLNLRSKLRDFSVIDRDLRKQGQDGTHHRPLIHLHHVKRVFMFHQYISLLSWIYI